ncbi:unnamed protein product [Toxocara canis]|uniref:DUF1648 domain-containing protein n=1 Tax=Toxocara canis TaxID=6265 RepID=A0A183TZX5_TOXCA|nr:unnamed protein product [Toxocara canis]
MRVSVVRSKLSALWTSPSLAAFLLINMLLICILLPVICVQIAHIALNERDQYQFKKLRIPLCTGSQFVPVYIVFKNVDVFFSTRPSDPTYVKVDLLGRDVFVVVTIVLLVMASFLPMFYGEYNFIKSIGTAALSDTALLFLVIKLTLFTLFAIELCIFNVNDDGILSSDLPIIVSAANVLFVYFSHTKTITKYNIESVKR